MVFRDELQGWDIFRFCKQKSFLHVWPFVRVDLSWRLNKVDVFVNKCAARASRFTYSTCLKVMSWNYIVALSQSLTLAPDLPGYLIAAPLLRQQWRCCSGKVFVVSSWGLSIPFFSSCPQTRLWDNTTSEPSLPVIHPLPSLQWLTAVHRKKLNHNLSNFCCPHLQPATQTQAADQSGGGKLSFSLSKRIVGPWKERFVCVLLAPACLCVLALHSRGKLGFCEDGSRSWDGSRVGSWLLRSFLW